jgi:hypothetical protein
MLSSTYYVLLRFVICFYSSFRMVTISSLSLRLSAFYWRLIYAATSLAGWLTAIWLYILCVPWPYIAILLLISFVFARIRLITSLCDCSAVYYITRRSSLTTRRNCASEISRRSCAPLFTFTAFSMILLMIAAIFDSFPSAAGC